MKRKISDFRWKTSTRVSKPYLNTWLEPIQVYKTLDKFSLKWQTWEKNCNYWNEAFPFVKLFTTQIIDGNDNQKQRQAQQ